MTRLDGRAMARIDGFGLANPRDAYLVRPSTVEGVQDTLRLAREQGRRIVLRGAGRSYGDAATLGEEIALDISRLNRVLSWDPVTGFLDAEAGLTLEDLIAHTLEDGWWPPVVPGTLKPTLAGCLAMNVHGKNNVTAGAFGEHVEEIEVVTAHGERVSFRRGEPGLAGFTGSLGLLGVVVRVKIRLKPVVSGRVRLTTVRTDDWDELFARFHEGPGSHRVGWIDAFHPSGRGVFLGADHDDVPDSVSLRGEAQRRDDTIARWMPKRRAADLLRPFLCRADMKVATTLRWGATRSGTTYPTLMAGLFPLDAFPDWQRAYAPGELIQLQFGAPEHAAGALLRHVLAECRKAKLEPFLAVAKRHRPDFGVIPYLGDGWSLALDFRRGADNRTRLNDLLSGLIEDVIAAEGRFYPAKDAILTADQYRRSVGEESFQRMRHLKAAWDPKGLFRSDFAARVGLMEESGDGPRYNGER